MSHTLCYLPFQRKQSIKLTDIERSTLTTIIDLLLPADEHFPSPSSLHLLDNLLDLLLPDGTYTTSLMLNEERLRFELHSLNTAAGGNFCVLSTEKQQELLSTLEQHHPAFFQALWTLINHTYYTHLAMQQPVFV